MCTFNGDKCITAKRVESILANKIWIEDLLRAEFGQLGIEDKLFYIDHHMSHAASAYYPSPFNEAAVLTIDGVGEWATVTIGEGKDEKLKLKKQQNFPHSLGLLYSAFTAYCGFKVNSGEYKLMGLAPYGEPIFYQAIVDNIASIKEDGSIFLNLSKFDFLDKDKMINERFCETFGRKARVPESNYETHYLDVAASIQKFTEDVVIKLAKNARAISGSKNLTMAGGVALNCVANGRLKESNIFDNIWIQPAAGDAGSAPGVPYILVTIKGIRTHIPNKDAMKSSLLGPDFSQKVIMESLMNTVAVPLINTREERNNRIAEYLVSGKVIGLFQGRMEYGPRSLGNRSIIADPRITDMQKKLNLQIKNRESFRPFAPSILKDYAQDFFDYHGESPHMLFVADVKEDKRIYPDQGKINDADIYQVVNKVRSSIPAVTHVDYTARLQQLTGVAIQIFIM